MTNEEQKLREFADKWGFSQDKTDEGFLIDNDKTKQCLSDLTALISEHYVAKEEVDKMVSEMLREDTYMTCDICGCHPSVIITTSFGKFCQQHAKYI